jgi:hypothetical protein
MKGLKKFLIAGFVAVAVLGLATTASAKTPKVKSTITVRLFKEKLTSPNNAWWVDKATSLIPIKNLKWNAKVSEISTNNSKCKIENRAVGAYYLNICAAKTVKPGDQTKVTFLVRQDGTYTVLNTTIKFKKAPCPLGTFQITGKDSLDHTVTVNFLSYGPGHVNEYLGARTFDYTVPAGLNLVKLEVAVAAPQTAVKIVGMLKNKCKEVRLYSGNFYELKNFSYIKVMYETRIGAAPAYFKAENDAYAGTKRFPVAKYCLLNLK